MRKLFLNLLLFLFLCGVLPMSVSAYSLSLPAMQPLEMDIAGYTGLYYIDENDNEVMRAPGEDPQVGDVSRSILRISNIYDMARSWGSTKDETLFTSTNNGLNLMVVQKGLSIFREYDYGDGRMAYFLDNEPGYAGYHFEAYLTEDFHWTDSFIPPIAEWDDYYAEISAGHDLWKGHFTTSTYDNPAQWGSQEALVGIGLDTIANEGNWLKNNEIPIDELGEFVNVEAWVGMDPDWSHPWVVDFWGEGKTIMIANMGLQAAGSGGWTAYADDFARGYTVPEPTTLILLGTGLLGLAAFGRKRLKITK